MPSWEPLAVEKQGMCLENQTLPDKLATVLVILNTS